jgi:MFS family permease
MTAFAVPLPSLKRHKPFALFWVMRVTTTGAYFMQSVAIGWQIYDMTGNPLDLGLVGLVQFFPLVLLAVVVGQIIDRYDRRAIARTCQIVKAICALVLALGSAGGWLGREAIFVILLVSGPRGRSRRRPCTHWCRAWCRRCCCRARSPHPRPRTRPRSFADPRSAA